LTSGIKNSFVSFVIWLVFIFSGVFNGFHNMSFINNIEAGDLSKSNDEFVEERMLMVKRQIKARGVKDAEVLKVMETVPRHEFVPQELQEQSYQDKPLPVGLDQTISQPYIVGFMTELLSVDSDDVVLEVGTGSGYQAAVLSLLVKQLYTIEIIDELGLQSRERLQKSGCDNVEVKIGDGYNGWLEHAPYDAIIVTAAPDHIPRELINQLKVGGKMVIPTGKVDSNQILKLITKNNRGEITEKDIIPVRFVPLTRKY